MHIGTVEPFLWDTSIQGTPPSFRGHKIWLQKNVHINFTSIEGTPLLRGEGHLF